jgi:outer membrane protein assembly factor BamB
MIVKGQRNSQRHNYFSKSGVAAFAFAVLLLAVCLVPTSPVSASDPNKGGDWPMWGGTPDRNMTSNMKGLPTSWDIKTKKNVKWVTALGSQTYGNPVVSGGTVFVGTNNEGVRDSKVTGDKGILMAFRESDGEFLWQAVSDKLAAGRVNDWPYQGVCSSPLVEGNRLYYVTNRAELVALDTQGFKDGKNDGVTDEKLKGEKDADVVWRFDMMEEVGSLPHNMANSSPVSFGDLIYVGTSNGQDESHVNIPSPKSPSIIAVNKNTGKLVWEDNSVFDKILHGQWSSPAVGKIGGVDMVVHPQGDGWIRGYDALSGKKLWEFDTNPKESVWPKTRNEVISTPVIYEDRVYIANGQDPEHGEGVGHMYCIDATKRGDITKTGLVWHYDKIRRSISTPAIKDGIVYEADFSGFLHALDAKTGEVYWTHDLFAAIWGSPILIDGKIYLGDEDGDVVILQEGKTKKVIGEMNMGSSVYSTPVPANGALFIANRNQLYALAEGAAAKPTTADPPKPATTDTGAKPAPAKN